MSYQTGAYSSPANLLSIIRAFLSSEGWTENEFDAGNNELHVVKNSIYWNLKAYSSATNVWDYRTGGSPQVSVYGIGAYISTGYSAGSGWDDQPGHSQIRSDTGALEDIGHPLNGKASGTYFMHSYAGSDDIFIACQPTDGLDPQTVMMAVGKMDPHDDIYMASSIGSFSSISLPTGFFAYSNRSGERSGHQGSVLVYALDPETGSRFWATNSCWAGTTSGRPYANAAPAGLPLIGTQTDEIINIANNYPNNYGALATDTLLAVPNAFDSYRTAVPLWMRMHRTENEGDSPGYVSYPKQFMCCSTRDTSPLLEYSVGSDTWKAYPNYIANGSVAHYILVKKET